MHIKDKVTTMSLRETSTCMSCYHYATGCQCGDKSLQTHAEHSVDSLSHPPTCLSPFSFLCHSFFYLPTLLTCLRVGRTGWLSGWLGAHGPRL